MENIVESKSCMSCFKGSPYLAVPPLPAVLTEAPNDHYKLTLQWVDTLTEAPNHHCRKRFFGMDYDRIVRANM